MRVAVELEFPDDRAAAAFQWLQSLPEDFVAHFAGRQQYGRAADSDTEVSDAAKATEREQQFYALFGAWKTEGETGDDFNRMLQEARHTEHRDIEL